MKDNPITSIDIFSHTRPDTSDHPFIGVFFGRKWCSNRTRFNPTPSSLLRIMRWQAATLLAARKAKTQS